MSDSLQSSAAELVQAVREALPQAELSPAPSVDMPTVYVPREQLLDISRTLRDDPSLQFSFLAEITAADYLPADPRFEVVYHFACLGAAFATGTPAPARRLRVKVRVHGDDPHVPSLTSLYPTAGWLEREVFDMFGIGFDGHPDLRRVLMPDDWEGHPLRKDYPVQIRKETRAWSAIQLTAEQFAANMQAVRDRAKAELDEETRRKP